jgi:glycosyltransferase involved in cell wall biosynthesis
MYPAKDTIEWLVPFVTQSEDDLKRSNLASVRLRTAVGAAACRAHGWQNMFSDGIHSSHANAVVVGKVDLVSDRTRGERWMNHLKAAKAKGALLIVDYTDHHLATKSDTSAFYESALLLADKIVVPSRPLSQYIESHFNKKVIEIGDPIEVPIIPPREKNLDLPTALWFGHASNIRYLIDFLINDFRVIERCRLIVMSNLHPLPEGVAHLLTAAHLRNLEILAVPWSTEDLISAAEISNSCWLPTGFKDARKVGSSSNRLITALALGLPVMTDDLPSYETYKEHYQNIRCSDLLANFQQSEANINSIIKAQDRIKRESSTNSLGQMWVATIREGRITSPTNIDLMTVKKISDVAKKKEIISIATITYNQEHFLDGIFKSGRDLTPHIVKHYIQDDCSTDQSWEKFKNLEPSEHRRVYRTPLNLGPRANIASLLERIEGEYVIFTGGDDLLVTDEINRLAVELDASKSRPDIFVFQCLATSSETLYETSKSNCRIKSSSQTGHRNSAFISYPWTNSLEALTAAAINPGLLWLQGMVIKTSLAKQAGFLPDGDVDDWGLQHNIAVIAMSQNIRIAMREEIICVLSTNDNSYGSNVIEQFKRQVKAVNKFWHPALRKAAILRVVEKKLNQLRVSKHSYEEIYKTFQEIFQPAIGRNL